MPRYRAAAQDLLVRRLALAAADQEQTELPADLEQRWQEARSAALRAELIESLKLPATVEISNAELRTAYDDNRELFFRPEQRNVWHLFRRRRAGANAEQQQRQLAERTGAVTSPAEFRALASEYSDSETRSLEGRLGWLERGRLPAALDQVVFSLAEGSTSAPVAVPGGWTVFFVSDVLPARQFTYEDVAVALGQWKVGQRLREAQLRALGDPQPPPGSAVSPDEAVVAAILGRRPRVLLQIGERRVTGAQLADRLAEQGAPMTSLPLPWRAVELYQAELLAALVDLEVERRELPNDPALMQRIAEKLSALQDSLRAEAQIQRWLHQRATASPQLERFFEDNRFLYQSEPAFRVRVWSMALPSGSGAEAAALAERASAAQQRLDPDSSDLSELVREIGGSVEEVGWVRGSGLLALAPKVRQYVAGLEGTGITEPFQLGNGLHVAQVVERKEPTEQPFAAVREKVTSDFLERSKQQLYAQLSDELAAEHEFEFLADNVAAALAAPDLPPAPTPGTGETPTNDASQPPPE
jgi:parvulin-like peptidyl-prolyl isomerase